MDEAGTERERDRGRPVAVILAGGQARRLGGGDKPLRLVGGRPVLAWALERLRPQCRTVLLNVNGAAERYAAFEVATVADDALDRDAGPLAGILTGLDAVSALDPSAAGVLTVPGDAPFLPCDLVVRLRRAAAGAAQPIAAASSGTRRHPTVALWPLHCADALRRLVRRDGVRRLETALAQIGTVWVPWSEAPVDPFHNINTPADLASANRIARHATDPAGQHPAGCL